ncbi:tumor necrosis factor b (TNF superfamily, member 2) [Electrophorus electricus]|uniref:tumor necrosis factor b (TNF superfamily, member 2) n=1 Tax=Electrophorus electricus TaxID=8005 RepID=UPI000F09D29F|nr:tumor necrosis factor b (TNF superfamily, member 2) [Electrophorus electricus]
MTAADLEMGMEDVYQKTVTSMKPSSGSEMWKIVGAIILVVLCATAAVFCTWRFTTQGPQEDRHKDMHSTPGTAHSQTMLKRIVKNRKAAIHLHASGQGSKEKSLQWESDVDQSFSKGGLRLKDNIILIPSDGIYFVYSQASFAVSCGSSEEDMVTLSHTVLWSSLASPSAEPKDLLNGFKSVCQANMQGQKNEDLVYDVIYLGAIFQLHKGDKLSTETTHANEIEDHGAKTFFGVFKL